MKRLLLIIAGIVLSGSLTAQPQTAATKTLTANQTAQVQELNMRIKKLEERFSANAAAIRQKRYDAKTHNDLVQSKHLTEQINRLEQENEAIHAQIQKLLKEREALLK